MNEQQLKWFRKAGILKEGLFRGVFDPVGRIGEKIDKFVLANDIPENLAGSSSDKLRSVIRDKKRRLKELKSSGTNNNEESIQKLSKLITNLVKLERLKGSREATRRSELRGRGA